MLQCLRLANRLSACGQLSDFGLAITGGSPRKTNIKLSGTLGYVAPEYLLDGKLSCFRVHFVLFGIGHSTCAVVHTLAGVCPFETSTCRLLVVVLLLNRMQIFLVAAHLFS